MRSVKEVAEVVTDIVGWVDVGLAGNAEQFTPTGEVTPTIRYKISAY